MHHFVNNLIKTTAHQMQDFLLEMYRKTFGSWALPARSGELKRSLDPSRQKSGGKGKEKEGKERRIEGTERKGKKGKGGRGG